MSNVTTYTAGNLPFTEYTIERKTANGWIAWAIIRGINHRAAQAKLTEYKQRFGYGNVRMR